MLCRFLTVLSLMILRIKSWDILVANGSTLGFLSFEGKELLSISPHKNITRIMAVEYDPSEERVFFSDSLHTEGLIFVFDINTNTTNVLLKKETDEHVEGLAYDPIDRLLFWTDTSNKSINFVTVSNSSNDDLSEYSRVLHSLENQRPRGITVDPCRRNVYWTNANYQHASIERSNVNGSLREIIVYNDLYKPHGLTINFQDEKLYWTDRHMGIEFEVERCDLDGNNRQVLYSGEFQNPFDITILHNFILWTDLATKAIWQLGSRNVIDRLCSFNSIPMGITSMQNQKYMNCQPTNKTELTTPMNLMTNYYYSDNMCDKYCLHDATCHMESNIPTCLCAKGYRGLRCEVDACVNFCDRGVCVRDELVTCHCETGFAGPRCELDLCSNYCLNNGTCLIVPTDNRLKCDCQMDYVGSRCEVLKPSNKCQNGGTYVTETDTCLCLSNYYGSRCTDNVSVLSAATSEALTQLNTKEWIQLGIDFFFLFLIIIILMMITYMWRKLRRARKRRTIVQPKSRSLSNSFDIEDCCNMNICETPCIESRTIVRPKKFKKLKEDQANLLTNQEKEQLDF